MEHEDWYEHSRQAMSREIGMSTLTRKPLTEQMKHVYIRGRDGTIVLCGTFVIRENVELTIDASDPDFDFYKFSHDWNNPDPNESELLHEQLRRAKLQLLQAVIENDVTMEAGSE